MKEGERARIVRVDGEEAVIIGLRGHILEPDFATKLEYKKNRGWKGIDSDGRPMEAHLPRGLAKPPYKTKRKPFLADGIDLKGWKMDALPYLVYAPIEKLPKEKDIIRSLKNLAKKADSVIIATDFDREGELIGSDAVNMVREVNATAPITRARYSSFTKAELEHAFAITVHKSQGSEYPCVIIPLYNCAPMLLTRNLLYTAVTRASRMVILVGREEVLKTMVKNDMHTTRHTGLCALLRND